MSFLDEDELRRRLDDALRWETYRMILRKADIPCPLCPKLMRGEGHECVGLNAMIFMARR